MPSSRQVLQNVALDAARDQRVFDLQVDDRMHRVRPANGVGADLGQADMPDPAGLDHVGHRADALLDRHVGIEPRRPIDVDGVDAEPLQRIGDEIPDRRRAAVIAEKALVGIAQRAELDADLDIVAIAAGERFADQHLIVAHAVEIAGVEQGDAGVERGVDGGDALAAVGRAVEIRHAHAAEADGRDGWTGGAEFALFHGGSPRIRRRIFAP